MPQQFTDPYPGPVGIRPPAGLCEAYVRRGWWGRASLTSLLAESLVTHAAIPVKIHSAVRPWTGAVGDLDVAARRVSAALLRRGVNPGDVVAIALPNWAEAFAAFYGALLAGAVVLPIPHFYGHRELRFALTQAAAKVLIVADRVGARDVVSEVDDVRATTPALECVVVVGGRAPKWAFDFNDFIDGVPLGQVAVVDPAATAAIAYTSGTGSSPKGVLLSHRALVFELHHHMTDYVRPRRPQLMGLPASHVGGMLFTSLHPVMTGKPLYVTDSWNPTAVLRAMAAEGLSAGSGSPLFLTSLLDDPHFTSAHADLMGEVVQGGSPVPQSLVRRATELGISVIKAYGSTEHPSVTATASVDAACHQVATVGQALLGVDLRAVDASGAVCGSGVPGEIQTRGPDMFSGYLDATATRDAIDADGWFSTGDVGALDDQGYLTITDRKKDVIIRGGENISAVEVEELLSQLPGVAEVAVVAGPDDRMGERACAFVRVRAAADDLTMPRMREHLRSLGLATRKWPEEIRIVDDFPRTASGKIRKVDLRAELGSTYAVTD
ncbi:AMP-binding protein [Mycolicibacterium hodleri]|uniref:AMP-dependent synthetase n=1 Tax=Mycolicibacterium hodleri TaxID=49897 RepID=A0A502EFY4_9MYCO|nr:AMP-binding protein [Mycolicibacterium hodleri]TPG36635.1 AMP-dependent synthetase [Mycolicibacterium hodleri]